MSSDICIVFHSGYGHTRKIAQRVAAGCDGALIEIDENGVIADTAWQQLEQSQAIVFGTPTYLANVSWQFKKFVDASSSVWMKQGWKNKFAAAFTNSAGINGDKGVTLQTIFAFTQQHGMLWISTGMMPSNAKASKRDDLNYLASFTGLMTATPFDASADEMVEGDLNTAFAFGQRIAQVLKAQDTAGI
jgi:NAD(P)H dehydrogenase (quinone)